jgi:Family of unknown function (DUF6416)
MTAVEDLEKVTVRIPRFRVPEFYRVVASWRSANEVPAATSPEAAVSPQESPASVTQDEWRDGDDAIAEQVWKAGNDNARKLYEVLAHAGGQPVHRDVLARTVGMEEGPNQFPGLLGAIGRTTWSRKRQVPWTWDQGNNTYTMPAFVADMFRKAASAD